MAKLWDEIQAKINVGEITDELIGAVKTGLTKTAIEQVASWAAALNPAGAIGKAVQAIYKVVKWVVNNWSKIQKLAESVVAGVKALIDGSGVEKVATLVEEGVAKVFQSAASFILSFFGLDAIPKTIRGVVNKLSNAVPDKVKELLGKLKKAIIDKLEKLWGGLGFWGRTEWTAGGEKHQVWADFKHGQVRTASPEQDAAKTLKELGHRAKDAKNEKAQKLVAEAQDVLKKTQQSLESVQSATQKSEQKGQKGAKKQGADAKVVQSESKKVQAGLVELAKLLKEIEEALGGGTCKIDGKKEGKKAGCWREGTRSRRSVGQTRAIEQWRRGRRIATLSVAEREAAAPPRLEIDPALWREVFLIQDDAANGGVLTMELLRPLEWLEQNGVELGAWVLLDLREMGVQGEALVTAVQPCPEIEEGEGDLVTGTFRRSKALVLELKVSGEPEVLGVTGNHLVWSEDRQDWVAVKDLDIGERMRAWDGSTPEVESLTACTEPEPVYNIEVEGDHCYRVGQQGLLVHNASAPCDPCAQRWPSGRRGLKYIDFDTIMITYKETMRDPNNPNKRITIGMQKSVQFKKVKQLIARLKYYGPDPTREPINTTRDWFRGDSSIGYESDAPGHILANIFGGYANVARGNGNLFPQNEYENENTLNYFERDKIKPEVIKPDSDVCIQIDFYFGSPGKPDRPITFDYSYWFNGVFQEKKPFTNPK